MASLISSGSVMLSFNAIAPPMYVTAATLNLEMKTL
jgi:hypothetical protein